MMEAKFIGSPKHIREEMQKYLDQTVGDSSVGIHYEGIPSERDYGVSYTVTVLNRQLPVACTCPDFHWKIQRKVQFGSPIFPVHRCKHMRKVLSDIQEHQVD